MKKTILILVIAVFALSSCTKTLYSHSDVMSRYRTKQDVILNFGEPTQKSEEAGLTLWSYDLGSTTIGIYHRNTNATASVYGGYGSANAKTFGVNSYSQYSRYVRFAFDRNGNTVHWTTQGVDFTEKKSNTLGTVVLLVLCLGAGVALAASTSGGSD